MNSLCIVKCVYKVLGRGMRYLGDYEYRSRTIEEGLSAREASEEEGQVVWALSRTGARGCVKKG